MSKYAAVLPLFVVVGAGIAFAAGHGTRLLAAHNDVQVNKRLVHPFANTDGIRLVSREASQKYSEENFYYAGKK